MARYLAECVDCGTKQLGPAPGRIKTWAELHERFHDHHTIINEVEDDYALVA